MGINFKFDSWFNFKLSTTCISFGFYFKSEIFESKTLLLFYKTDILNVIQKGLDGELILNLPKGLDEDIYYQLKISGIYVSMIGNSRRNAHLFKKCS